MSWLADNRELIVPIVVVLLGAPLVELIRGFFTSKSQKTSNAVSASSGAVDTLNSALKALQEQLDAVRDELKETRVELDETRDRLKQAEDSRDGLQRRVVELERQMRTD